MTTWIEAGNFETVDLGFGKTKSIQYRYDDDKHPSKITAVLLDTGRKREQDFFRVSLLCSDEEVCDALAKNLKAENLVFSSAEDKVFLKSAEVSELMKFMTVVEGLEPKVKGLKEKISRRCEEGFPSNGPVSPDTYTPAADLAKKRILVVSRPPIVEVTPKPPKRWCRVS